MVRHWSGLPRGRQLEKRARTKVPLRRSAETLEWLEALEHEHSIAAISARLTAGPRQNYLRDWIYGGIDGAVTTFAVVSGIAGAQLAPWIILVMGFANLFADGFSMAASNFLGTKSEHENWHRLEAI